MVVLRYPDDYQLTRATEPPPGHRFAIGAKEVTVQDFGRFRPESSGDDATPAEDTRPANNMDWYAAAAYCNWLNEQEGIPPDQWCYQPNEEGQYAEGMTIASDFLTRRGYRLPIAAEWLFAASAGVRTPFFFGSDAELLLDYAWMAQNSQGMHHPVGTLQPNLLGMFDVYGNVKEWSHSLEEERREDIRVIDGEKRSVLGGCFMHFQAHFRAYYAKHGNSSEHREDRNGFRIARTLLPL
jgi:formylglycine-generating enzyme required for sulfatase activity